MTLIDQTKAAFWHGLADQQMGAAVFKMTGQHDTTVRDITF
jgi:hypothetical protein